jgi:hypothetical protein
LCILHPFAIVNSVFDSSTIAQVIFERALKRLHPDSSLSKSSLNFWRRHSNEEIVESLAPGKQKCLKVKANGIIMDGNTRMKVLEERGYPVDTLPFEPYG